MALGPRARRRQSKKQNSSSSRPRRCSYADACGAAHPAPNTLGWKFDRRAIPEADFSRRAGGVRGAACISGLLRGRRCATCVRNRGLARKGRRFPRLLAADWLALTLHCAPGGTSAPIYRVRIGGRRLDVPDGIWRDPHGPLWRCADALKRSLGRDASLSGYRIDSPGGQPGLIGWHLGRTPSSIFRREKATSNLCHRAGAVAGDRLEVLRSTRAGGGLTHIARTGIANQALLGGRIAQVGFGRGRSVLRTRVRWICGRRAQRR